MEQPAIAVQGLTVHRGRRLVLDALSLTVEPGTVTGLLGPSGCGKSTLLRAVVGVQRIMAGAVQVLGQPAGSAALRRRVGYMTQTPSVYPDLTVHDNLVYFGRVLGVPAKRITETVDLVDLGPSVGQLVGRLSGGQRSRVSLAIALLGHPDLLILDEPTVGLDPVLRRSLWQAFHRLADEGATLVVSSHVMDEAERCDRLLLMYEGSIIATGAPAALLAATEAPSMDDAFLRLIESEVAG